MSEELSTLTLGELRARLKTLGEPVSGSKAVLVTRLTAIDQTSLVDSLSSSSSEAWRRASSASWQIGGFVLTLPALLIALIIITGGVGLGVIASNFLFDKEPDYQLMDFDPASAREYAQGLVEIGNPGRLSGSVQEQATADSIQENLTAMGLTVEFESFSVPMFEILDEPELAYCIPGTYFGFITPTPCGPADINADIRTFTHLEDFVLQGYSGSRDIRFNMNEYTIVNLSNGSDEDLWSASEGQVGMVWMESTGVGSNTELYGRARDGSLAGLIIVPTAGNNCRIPGLEGTCVPFFKTVNVNDLGTMPTDIPFMMVSNDVGSELMGTFADKQNNSARLRLYTDMSNDGNLDVRVPCGVISGRSDEMIILGGHHDTVYNGPGAVDDTSGVATVLELARQFAMLEKDLGAPFYTMKFCTWGGEEEGLHGSTAYVELHAGELSKLLRLYINFDMPHVDLDPETRGNTIWFYGNGVQDIEHIDGIVKKFEQSNPALASRYSLSSDHVPDDEMGCSSDHCPFVRELNKDIVGSYGTGSWEYHTYKDDMSRFNEESLIVTGTVLGSYARYLSWGEA